MSPTDLVKPRSCASFIREITYGWKWKWSAGLLAADCRFEPSSVVRSSNEEVEMLADEHGLRRGSRDVKVQSGITLDLLVLIFEDHADGLEILHMFRRSRPTLPVVLIGHSGDVHRKQESIRVGARGYLMRPLEDHQLDAVILESLSGVDDTTETDSRAATSTFGVINPSGLCCRGLKRRPRKAQSQWLWRRRVGIERRRHDCSRRVIGRFCIKLSNTS